MTELNPLIIMAAGKGSRMRASAQVPEWVLEEAASRPKAMIRIGPERIPMLQRLVEQARAEGVGPICIVIGEGDDVTRPHFEQLGVVHPNLHFVKQPIPPDRTKPLGTAHAVQVALEAHPEWSGSSVTIVNGDNLPPLGVLQAMQAEPACLPAFDRDHLGLPAERVHAFAVIEAEADGRLQAIHEKPDGATVNAATWRDGTVRVSMNCFRMPFNALLTAVREVPEHPVRQERELPTAVSVWAAHSGQGLRVLPMTGRFYDLTHPEDILKARNKLDQGAVTLQV